MSSEMLDERLEGFRAAPAAEDSAPADELAARPSRVFAGDLEWKPPAAPNYLRPALDGVSAPCVAVFPESHARATDRFISPRERRSLQIHECLKSALFALGLASCDEVGAPEPRSHGEGRAQHAAACDSVPAPRWVLRDKDGQRVPALVEPRCGVLGSERASDCWPRDFGESDSFPCVRVIDHARRYINLQYDLATGRFGPCHGSPEDLEGSLHGVYTNANCEGQQYGGGIELDGTKYTSAQGVYPAAGQWWYVSEQGCVGSTEHWWSDGQTCHHDPEPWRLCPLKPVPQWVTDLLPNPPYTLAVEYD